MPIDFFHSPILVIILPLIGGFITPGISLIADRFKKTIYRDYLVFGFMAATIFFIINTAIYTWGDIYVYPLGGWLPPLGISVVIDGLGVLIGLIVASISLLVLYYSLRYMKDAKRLSQFYTLMLFLIAGMVGVAFTGDIFNLYVFFEIMSIASYALIAFYRTSDSIEASLKYIIIGSLGTGFILTGIVLLYAMTGTLNIADLAVRMSIISGEGFPLLSLLALGFLLVGFGMKVGMIPFHAWLPDAYQGAPIPVTTIMAGGTGIIGISSLLRVVFIIYGEGLVNNLLLGLGLLTMIIGALLALKQYNLKRLLAYSSISQIGYVLFGLGIGNSLGLSSGLYHLMNKAIFKSLLFLLAGIIITKLRTDDMRKLGGLASKMPVTAVFFAVGSLALVGIPPLNGFVSKAGIIYGGMQAGHHVLSIIAAFSATLTVIYILRAFILIFLGEEGTAVKHYSGKRDYHLLLPAFILVLACLAFGIFPNLGFNAVAGAEEILLNPSLYIQAVFP